MELAVLRCGRPGLVPELSLLHEVRQAGLLSRCLVAPRATDRVQKQRHALLSHPRRRPIRRGPIGRMDQAGQRIARRKNVSGLNRKNYRTESSIPMKKTTTSDAKANEGGSASEQIDLKIR